MSSWPDALDALEAALERQRTAIEEDPPSLEAFAPPAGLGPIPAELRPRAEALLESSRRIERRAAHLAAARGRDLAMVRGAKRPAPGESSKFVDQRV